MNISVCHSPKLIDLYDLTGSTVVVIDIFRATSCMVAGLGNGVKSIVVHESQESCSAMAIQGYKLAGERNGVTLQGFDYGNSPFEYMAAGSRNESISMTTTNGTKAIEAASSAKQILIGSFLNLDAICNYIGYRSKPVIALCAGWKDRINMEDTLFAGALVESLISKYKFTTDDAGSLSQIAYLNAKNQLVKKLSDYDHPSRLAGILGSERAMREVEICLDLNRFPIVVEVQENRELTLI